MFWQILALYPTLTRLHSCMHVVPTPLCSPSGSGKTTLLDVLAGRKTVGQLEGAVAFAGNKPTPQFLRRFTGYVEQFGGCCCLVQRLCTYAASFTMCATASNSLAHHAHHLPACRYPAGHPDCGGDAYVHRGAQTPHLPEPGAEAGGRRGAD